MSPLQNQPSVKDRVLLHRGARHRLLERVLTVDGVLLVRNCVLNRVGFPALLRVGDRVGMHVTLVEAQPLGGGGVQVGYRLSYEIEGRQGPAAWPTWCSVTAEHQFIPRSTGVRLRPENGARLRRSCDGDSGGTMTAVLVET